MPLTNVQTFENLQDLRNYAIPYGSSPNTLVYYVKCHTNYSDGGGGFFSYTDHPSIDVRPDNDGTIIQAKVETVEPSGPVIEYGKWIRKIDNYINIRFFGCQGAGDPLIDETARIQKAIDYAATTDNYLLRGNTIFFPQGVYCVYGTLVLQQGVSLLGESYAKCQIRAEYYDDGNDVDYLLKMDKGRIIGCNISNLEFYGNTDPFKKYPAPRTKGCMRFEAIQSGDDGGMWGSTFKNIHILGFNGNCIRLKDSGMKYKSPNQQLIFENLIVQRQTPESYCLYVSGQHGQMTFINAGFDGIMYNKEEAGRDKEGNIIYSYDALKGRNVFLEGTGTRGIQPIVVSFINSTFQYSEYGVFMSYCECITFDNCWFETLDLAVAATNKDKERSVAINVLNSHFANAGGFGSLLVRNQHVSPSGRCITSTNSEMNVYNNHVTVSHLAPIEGQPFSSPFGKDFIMGLSDNSNYGIRTTGNTFLDPRLGYSNGIKQYLQIEPDPDFPGDYYLNLKDNKIVIVNPGENDGKDIERIVCSVSAGEIVSIRAHERSIHFNNNKNIFFSNQSGLTLDNGDIATFIKIDYAGNFGLPEIFQLIAVLKSSSPL